MRAPNRFLAFAAFFSVFFFWGSTYLATQIAVQGIPPFLMLGLRFVVAGGALYAVCRIAKVPAPTGRQWLNGALQGFLLIFGGNVGVTWAVQHIPGGTAALLIATEPLWLVLMLWVSGHCGRPSFRTVAGLLLGFAGIVALAGGEFGGPGNWLQGLGFILTLETAFAWSLGSVVGVRADNPRSPFMSSAVVMVAGGAMCSALGLGMGEAFAFRLEQVPLAAWLAVGYLTVFGSIAGISAYIWLLRNFPTQKVAAYAFVNPLVAVGLGWAFAGEPITTQVYISAALIVGSVVLLVRKGPEPASQDQVGLVAKADRVELAEAS